MKSKYITAQQAIDILNVSRGTFYNLVNQGHIKAFAANGFKHRRYLRDEVENWVESSFKEVTL